MLNTILSLVFRLYPNATVKEVINSKSCYWKMDFLQEIFANKEIRLITSIPLNLFGRANQLVWNQTKNIIFNVKSVYHLHQAIINGFPNFP